MLIRFIQVEVAKPEEVGDARGRRSPKPSRTMHVYLLAIINGGGGMVYGTGQCAPQALWVKVYNLCIMLSTGTKLQEASRKSK